MHPVLFHIGPLLIPTHGVLAALGVLLALALLHRTARQSGLAPSELWNLALVSLCAALVGARVLLFAVHAVVFRVNPAALVNILVAHALLYAALVALIACAAAAVLARARRLSLAAVADALSAPIALALSVEQLGALFSGAGYGSRTAVPWAITYSSPLALHWSGVPLFVAVHPVQLYAALAFFVIALGLLAWAPRASRPGDLAGIFLLAAGSAVYLTEFFRNPAGRLAVFAAALTAPQLAAVAAVLAGALILRERPAHTSAHNSARNPAHV